MDKKSLQHCLQVMQITRWQKQETAFYIYPYLVIVESEPNEKENELLTKILAALSWPLETTKIVCLQNKAQFNKLIERHRPEKILLSSLALAENLGFSKAEKVHFLSLKDKKVACAITASLTILLADRAAKKQAWSVMQALAK